MMARSITQLLLLPMLAACAVMQPARMEQPPGLEARAVAATIEGLGGGTRGSFKVAGNQGSFTRSATRLDLLDELVTFDRGSVAFTLQGADFPSAVSAKCEVRQTTGTLRFVQFKPRKFGVDCRYQGLAAHFLLVEADPASGVQTLQAERRGEWTGTAGTLTVRSVHTVAGGALPLPDPIGYRIDAGGVPVATVELNGLTPRLLLPADEAQRRDALLIALTLALLWDPASR